MDPTTPENLSARRRHTRSTLVEAGISVFAVKGIDGASIEEICEAAGFTRGAFYSNFSSRDDLVLATIEQRTKETLDRLDRTIGRWRTELGEADHSDIESLLTTFIDDIFSEKQETVAETIAEHEIELYCLRVPHLQERFEELGAHQFTRLESLVTTALEAVGARTTIPLADLLVVLTAIHSQTSLQAAAGKALHERIELDPRPTVAILMALIEFPDGSCARS